MYNKTIAFLLAVLLIFVIFAQFLVVSSEIFQKSVVIKEECKNYIIKFKDPSLSKFRVELKEKIKNLFPSTSENSAKSYFNNKYKEYKYTLFSNHINAKNKILKTIGNNNEQEVIIKEFKSIFNGVVIKDVSSKLIEKIKALPFVESVFEDKKLKLSCEDSVDLINADEVWEKKDSFNNSITGENITIAILDTGIDYHHIKLKDNYIGGYDFVNNDNDPMDDVGHGTLCAGIAVSVAPCVQIFSMKVLDSSGESSDSELIYAIHNATDPNGDGNFSDQFIDVISLSLGSVKPGNPTDPICVAVDDAFDAGLVVVASAGNNGSEGLSSIRSPGCAFNSICVGATDKDDNIAGFSSKGPVFWDNEAGEIVKPDIVAPGVRINSTYFNNGSIHASGTSMSTPFVAGAAALLLQAHPEWTPGDVKNALKESAIDIGYYENVQGAGRLDVLNAYYYPKLPKAILSIPEVLHGGLIDIRGTVKTGSGNPDDLISYNLYYKKYLDWKEIYEGYQEIDNDVLMSKWNISEFAAGKYKIKLEVKTINQTTSIDIKTVNIAFDDDLIIDAPDFIYESANFTVRIYDENLISTNAFGLLLTPFHLPQIKYGNALSFKTPRIINPFAPSLQAKLIIIKIIGMKKVQCNITFLNDKCSFYP
jgi:subtilisin family serine protease